MIIPNESFSADDKLVPTNMLNIITSVLNCLDFDTETLVRGSGLSVSELKDPYALISFQQCCCVIKNALKMSHDPALGLTLAEQGGFASWGILGSALASCESALDAIHVGMQLCPPTWLILSLEEGSELSIIQLNTAHAVGSILPCIMEEAFGSIVWMIKNTFNNAMTPKQLQLTYRSPEYADKYQKFFQCPVLFNQPANRLIWETAQLTIPNPSYNPATKHIAIDACKQVLDKQANTESLPYIIRRILIQNLEDTPSMEEIANNLGMTERTLRRKLKHSGTNFQSIVDDLRKNIAIEQLQTTDMSIKDIAYMIGMRDAGNFSRAFKKWTGKTTTDYRH